MTQTIRVLDNDVEAYQRLLASEPMRGFDIEIVDIMKPTDIILGQPDLIADRLDQIPHPRWVQSTWAGVTPLVTLAKDAGIVVTGLKGIFGPLIAEFVMSILLNDVRKTETYRTAQTARQWLHEWPETLRGKTVAVVGTGSIGSSIAGIAKQFRMRTLGISRSGNASGPFDETVSFGEAFAPRTRTAAASDHGSRTTSIAEYVVATLPDTPATARIIDGTCFAAMGNAIFVNVGRAATVDRDDLFEALERQVIRAAYLDVFDHEPLLDGALEWLTPNLHVTPHIAGVSYPEDVLGVFADNLERYQAGRPLVGVIDLDTGY